MASWGCRLERHQRLGASGASGTDRPFPRSPLLQPHLSPILIVMEVHFTPEQEAQLTQIASKAGTDAERLVKDAALRLLEAVAELSVDEEAALATWLNGQKADEWDRQMQKDFSTGGRALRVVEKVKADISAGRFKPMDKKST